MAAQSPRKVAHVSGKGGSERKKVHAGTYVHDEAYNDDKHDLTPWSETPKSSRVSRYRYDYQNAAIQVQWRNNKNHGYIYLEVPEEGYLAFVRAASKGKHINTPLSSILAGPGGKAALGVEVYWGWEYDIPAYDHKYVSYAWLIEDLPPYRRSKWGARLHAGSRALHFGICTRAEDPHRRLPEIPVRDISTWRGPHAVEEEVGADPGGESLRPAEQRQLVPDAGGEPRDGDDPG